MFRRKPPLTGSEKTLRWLRKAVLEERLLICEDLSEPIDLSSYWIRKYHDQIFINIEFQDQVTLSSGLAMPLQVRRVCVNDDELPFTEQELGQVLEVFQTMLKQADHEREQLNEEIRQSKFKTFLREVLGGY